MTVPFTFQPDGSLRLSGVGVTLFTAAANPNGTVTALAVGDLCVTNEPALYQATEADNSHWVSVGGGGAGFDGTYSGTTGIHLTDNSSSGNIILSEEDAGGSSVNVGGGSVSLQSATVEGGFVPAGFSLQANRLQFTDCLGGGYNTFFHAGNPNGHVVALNAGDLCVTDEPALYQAASGGVNNSWVQVGASVASTTGIHLIDNSAGGSVFLAEEDAGGSNINLGAGTVILTSGGAAFSLQSDFLSFSNNTLGGGFSLHYYATNPNGHVTALAPGDLCVTSEPALYQATAGGNSHWVSVMLSPSSVPAVTGSRTDGTALASLITALAGLGFVTDSTTG